MLDDNPARYQSVVEAPSGHRAMVGAVGSALVDLCNEYGYQELTLQNVADRAGLAHVDVCAHFASVEAMIAKTCLAALCQAPLVVDFDASPRQRLIGEFHRLIMLLAFEPRYGAACVWALMSSAPSVRPVRTEVDEEIRRRVSAALGTGAWPELVSTLQMSLLGAVVQAATSSASLVILSQQLGDLVDMLMPE